MTRASGHFSEGSDHLRPFTTLRMNIRHFLLLVTLASASLRAADKPNIVFILADDIGYGDLGCYGQRRIATPNIDALAARGIRFSQFYAGAPVCAPSRNVLMTGEHTGHTQIRGNSKEGLRAEDTTIAQVLHTAGYANGLIGKWGLGSEGTPGAPRRKGFDYFFGYVDQTHAHNYYPTYLVRNETHVPLRNVVPDPGAFGQGVAVKKVDYSPDLLTADALEFLRSHQAKPFFLFFSSTLPHANDEAKGDGMEVPGYGPYARDMWPNPEKGFAAMITKLDSEVGELVDELKKLGLADNTVVIFTSDNGPHREGGHDVSFFGSAGGLRGAKRELYEGGIRVPFIVAWPGHTPPGTICADPAYLGDLFPTFAELAHAAIAPHPDALSLAKVFAGQPNPVGHPFLYWEFYEGASAQAVRLGRWKAVRMPMLTGFVQLYDLENDPSEMHNVSSANPELVDKIRNLMQEQHVGNPLWFVDAAAAARYRQ